MTTIRGEVRYDMADLKNVSDDNVYSGNNGPGSESDQFLIGFEAIYEF